MDSLICPAPPINHAELSGEMLQSLVVPTPSGMVYYYYSDYIEKLDFM